MSNKNINILTHSIIILFLLIHLNVRADEIHLKDGTIITGKIQSVSPDEIKYIPEKEKKKKEVSRSNAVKIKYDDGTVVNFAGNEGGSFLNDDALLSKGKQSPFIFEDKTEPFLLPFMLRLGLMMNKGRTKVKIYDKNEKQIADGDADFDQYLLKFSYEPVQTAFYFTPELGYFYRKVAVKDYSYSVESVNQGIEGFIPGIVTDPDTGAVVPKDSISSLAYSAKFHSFFLDLKTGYNVVLGYSHLQFIFNPYLYTSLVELRKSEFEFGISGKKEKYSMPYSFSYISAYGFGCEIGLFFPGLRSGIKVGYDRRYLPKFEISDKVKFKEVIYNDDLGIYTTKENSAKYTSVTANLFIVEFFFFM